MKFKYFLVVVLLSALIVAVGCSKPLAGQAISGFSDVGCVEGPWVYLDGVGNYNQFEAGCTTQFSDKDANGDPIPWCATSTVSQGGYDNVYITGNGQGTQWKECSQEEVQVQEMSAAQSCQEQCDTKYQNGELSRSEAGACYETCAAQSGESSEEVMIEEGTGYGGNEPVPCKDSDGGLNYNKKGTLTNPDGEIYEDFCSWGDVTSAGAGVKKDSSDYVYEYYCMDSGKAGTVIEKCTGGCKDGKGSGVCGEEEESTSICGLGKYPQMFVKEGVFDGYFVVGDKAGAIDNLAATDIATSMKVNTKPVILVDAVKLDSEINDVTAQNLIVIGSPCVNDVTSKLGVGSTSSCTPEMTDTSFKKGESLIKLIVHNSGKSSLVVSGYSGEERRVASKVIAHRTKELNGVEVKIEGTTYMNAVISVKDNACGSVTQKCTDSDGGSDIYTKGTTKGIAKSGLPTEIGKQKILSDSCQLVLGKNEFSPAKVVAECVINEGDCRVAEYFCEGDDLAGKSIPCPSGCKDGACVKVSSGSGGGGGGSGTGGGVKPASASYTNSWKVETATNKLELANSNTTDSGINGEEVREIVAFVGKKEISELGDGVWNTNEQGYGYKQFLFFDEVPGTTRSRIVKYAENDVDEVADHFYIGNAKQIARYKLEFDTDAKSDITDKFGSADAKGKYLDDFDNTELTLFGKKYTVVQATRPTVNPKNSITLALMTGAAKDTILEGEQKKYELGDKTYEVTLSYLSADEAKFIINGETTMMLGKGDTYVLKDKSEIGVSNILYQAYAGGVHSAIFFLGREKMELRDDNVADQKGDYEVNVNEENIDGSTVIIKGTDNNLVFSLQTIEVNMIADDDFFVGAGSKLSDSIAATGGEKEILFTNNWDFEYKGLAEQKTHEISLKPEGGQKYVLTLFDANNVPIKIPVAQVDSAGKLVLPTGTKSEYSDSYGSKWTITDKTKTTGTIVLTQTTPNADDYDNVKPSDIVLTLSALNQEVRAKFEGPIGPNAGMVLLTPDGKTDVSHGYTSMGTFVTYKEPADDPQEVTLQYPEKQKLPQLYVVSGKK